MTGHRKSCKTCKKVAGNSLPFVETSVPVVDGFLYQNIDHDENPTPGFSPRVADAISDPATAGTAAAYATLGRTEPTPGLRKTAQRKAAAQASSFTVVAHQTTPQTGAAGDKDNDGPSDKDTRSKANDPIRRRGEAAASSGNSACGDKNDPKGAAGCSDQHASKDKVAASVAAKTPVAATIPEKIHESVKEVFYCYQGDELIAMYPVNGKNGRRKTDNDNTDDLWKPIEKFYLPKTDKSNMKNMKGFAKYFIEHYEDNTKSHDHHFGLKIDSATWVALEASLTKKGKAFGSKDIPDSLSVWKSDEKWVVGLFRYIDEIVLQDCVKREVENPSPGVAYVLEQLKDKLQLKDRRQLKDKKLPIDLYMTCLNEVRSHPTYDEEAVGRREISYTRPKSHENSQDCNHLELHEDQTYYAKHVISDYAWGTDHTEQQDDQSDSE